jgi:hypothetical protein
MPLLGKQIDPISMFQGGPFGGAPQGAIDLEAFEKITSADLAFKRLNWLRNYDVVLRGFHAPSDMQRMWRAVFRSSLAYGSPIPTDMIPYARALGVVIPSSS